MDRIRKVIHSLTSGFLWLFVLAPILGVSGWSFFWIAEHWGAPWFVAIAVSTCFDGAALLMASYSVRYAEEGLSGSGPRTVVRLIVGAGVFIQTFHAHLDHEPPGGIVLWGSLPVISMLVYETHVHWIRRKALSRRGHAYPTPLPSFGAATWILFPWTTLTFLREIVEGRRRALAGRILSENDAPAQVPAQARPEPARIRSDPISDRKSVV